MYYKFTNTQNGSVEDKLNINKKNKRFHLELTYDHNGTLHINKSEYYDLFTNQLIDGALENIDNYYYYYYFQFFDLYCYLYFYFLY